MPGSIVVGVDGSVASREALRWAAEEARLRAARLVVVHAWTFIPAAPIGDPGMMPLPSGDLTGQLEAEAAGARSVLDTAIAEAFGEAPPVELVAELLEGDPGEALVEESSGVDLLVVGSHGRSGIRAALLGSVCRHVVDHARCPVVVVKAAGD